VLQLLEIAGVYIVLYGSHCTVLYCSSVHPHVLYPLYLAPCPCPPLHVPPFQHSISAALQNCPTLSLHLQVRAHALDQHGLPSFLTSRSVHASHRLQGACSQRASITSIIHGPVLGFQADETGQPVPVSSRESRDMDDGCDGPKYRKISRSLDLSLS
jgi:hypothetical protein